MPDGTSSGDNTLTLPGALLDKAQAVLDLYRERGLKLATAESCTGGLIAACLTALSGSSDVVERGFVTYANEAKEEMIGVPEELLAAHGAVSAGVAEAMARGALEHSRADRAVAVTGIAGPGGATDTKPVGLVYVGYAGPDGAGAEECHFSGDRHSVRLQTVEKALERFRELAGG